MTTKTIIITIEVPDAPIAVVTPSTTAALVALPPPARVSRRWKVQRRVDVYARDRGDKQRRLFATTWHTVREVDRIATAERVYNWNRREDRAHEFRIAEEWPIGSELRAHKCR